MAVQEFFTWGEGGAKLTPEQLAQRRLVLKSLKDKEGDMSPVQHWTQGLARVADAFGNNIEENRLGKAETELNAYNSDILSGLLGPSSPVASPAAPPVDEVSAAASERPSPKIVAALSPSGGGMEPYRNAIASIESAGSGDYSAIGPTNPKLGRALGRYQIMEANIGPWSQEALGKVVTPEEFIANPQLQDAIFDKKFGSYVQQFGPEGAAQAWFAGPGGVGKTDRRDVLGTSVGSYGSKFTSALGQSAPQAAIEAVAPTGASPTPAPAPQRQVAQALASPPSAAPQAPAINPAILKALSDPRATPQTRAVAQALMQQQMGQQQAAQEMQMRQQDPRYQQQLQLGQIEIDKARNPGVDGVAVGNRIVDRRTGNVIYEAPAAPEVPKAPDIEELYDPQTGQPYKATWNPETKQFDRVGGIKAPSGTALTVSPDGQVSFTQGGAKPLTENQSKLTLFQSLQTETQPVLLDLEKQFNPANLQDAAARSTPIAGNFFKTEQGQIYDSAATAWAEGALRIATGAAATPEEMERTKRAYFAQPGDTPNTIAFKAQMREMYGRSIDRSLGKKSEGNLPSPGEFAKKFDDTESAPQGVDASDWEFMTPEERRLFQ